MAKRYKRHDRRPVQDLAGLWDFAFLGDVDPQKVMSSGVNFRDRMPVPGCFDVLPDYAGKRGLAAYRTQVVLADSTRHRIVLDGVHHWCRVLLDGETLGEHVGGFTQFHFDVVGHAPGPAELIVLVDNRIDYDRCPLHLDYFDWYHYGGIARGAQWHQLGPAWIETVRVTTLDYRTGRARLELTYGCDEPARAVFSVECCDRALVSDSVELAPGGGVIEREIECDKIKPWSPEHPNLCWLMVRLGGDDLRLRVGLRQVRVEGRQLLINDEPVRLLGVNRHEAHPQFGHAVPLAIQAGDVQLLRQMGGNFLRGSHYPQDSRLLDLCDEAGILVWSEATAWQPSAEHVNDPAWLDAQKTNIREMIDAAYNHPSVILWGLLNEGESHKDASRPGYETLIEYVRQLDSSRPVTFATNHPEDDCCLDLADVVALNIYPGWYGCEIEQIPAEIDRCVNAALARAGDGDKPVLISEIGAGAVYGLRDSHAARWSEQYQAKLLEAVIRAMFSGSDRFCGLAIWQFCDCRTTERAATALKRPRGFNNKGLVDEYRRPKLAFEAVARLLRQIPRPGDRLD